MYTRKILKKYCTNDKVQVKFSNASRQIICSKDGYLYLRNEDINIHKYLSDPIRHNMPDQNSPVSNNNVTHLFKYDQIYAKFTRCINMSNFSFLQKDSFSLNFLYFHKLENKTAIACELNLKNFIREEETETTYSKRALKKFLYDTSKITGKYIFEKTSGIMYAKSKNEAISIKNFLDLSNDSIIKLYNQKKENINTIPYKANLNKSLLEKKNTSWKAHTIDEVTEFCLTNDMHNPYMLIITNNEIYVYEFKVIYCNKHCFKVKSRKINITINLDEILASAQNAKYLLD